MGLVLMAAAAWVFFLGGTSAALALVYPFLRAPLESSYYSSSMSHLDNISVRVGQSASDASLAAQFSDNEFATETLQRFSSQLALWNVDTNKTPWHAGSELTVDAEAEQFVAGDNKQQANALLRREDRAPYIVPETV